MPQSPGKRAPGNLGTQCHRRRNFEPDGRGLGSLSLHFRSAHGRGPACLGSVSQEPSGAVARPGAGYRTSGKICRNRAAGNRCGPAPAFAARGVSAAPETLAAHQQQIRGLQTVPAGALDHPPLQADLRLAAEAVEKCEEDDAEDGIDERGDGQVHVEPAFGFVKEQTPHYRQDRLVNYIEDGHEGKTRERMLGIQARTNRGCQVTNDGLGNSIFSERYCWSAKAVLHDPNGCAKQQSGGRIAPAQAEINSGEQRKIQDFEPGKINRKNTLQHQRKDRNSDHSAGEKFVDFDVRFATAEFKGVVHGFSGAGFPAAEVAEFPAAGCAVCASASFLKVTTSCVKSTITSSRRSSLAAGFTRICLKGLPCFTSSTVPMGMSRGKILSMPLVTTLSPALTVSSAAT